MSEISNEEWERMNIYDIIYWRLRWNGVSCSKEVLDKAVRMVEKAIREKLEHINE